MRQFMFGLTMALGFLAMIVNASYSQTMAENRRDYLKDLRNIRLIFNYTPEPLCPISEAEMRNSLINILVPAGLRISEEGATFLLISATNVSAGNQRCASAVEIGFRRIEPIISPQDRVIFMPVVVGSWGSIFTVGSSTFRAAFLDTLRTHIDSFLAEWRTVNAGSEFVRQAPPINIPTANQQTPPAPNIRTVQQRLQILGHYQGAVDGLAGPGTRQAVQAFQRAQQLPATGDLDLETMRRLFP